MKVSVARATLDGVERGEEEIRALGFRQFRVRFHGELVRIEIAPDELAGALARQQMHEIVEKELLAPLASDYVMVDQ